MTETPYFELLVIVVLLGAIAVVIWYSRRQQGSGATRNTYLSALERLAEGNEREAVQLFKAAVRENTDNIPAYLYLGDLLRRRGMLSNAVKIHRDLTLRPGLSPDATRRIRQSLVRDYHAMGNAEEGAPIARELLEKERLEEPWIAMALLEMLEQQRRWDEAAGVLDRYGKLIGEAIDVDSRAALYLVFRGLALQDAGKGRDARIKYKEALKRHDRCAAAYYYLGRSYHGEGRLDDAVSAWTRLCEAIPEKAFLAFPELEKAWFEIGRFADAETLYQNLLARKPASLPAGLALAEIYAKKGDFEGALEVMEQLESEYGDGAHLAGRMTRVLHQNGQYKQAADRALAYFEGPGRAATPAVALSCRKCNTQLTTPEWICPSCGAIDSFGT